MHNAEQVWLCPEDGGTTSYNPVCDFSLTAPNIPLNVYPAIRFQYGKNDGSYGTMDTFWVSGSINDLLQKANASTGGAASTYIVSAISPFS